MRHLDQVLPCETSLFFCVFSDGLSEGNLFFSVNSCLRWPANMHKSMKRQNSSKFVDKTQIEF